MEKSNTEQAVIQPKNDLSPATLPDWGDGAEDVSLKDVSLSFVKVIQKTSGEFDSSGNGGSKMGDFFDTISKFNFGKELKVDILMTKSTWIEFDDKKGVKRRSNDGTTWDDGAPMSDHEHWEFKKTYFFIMLNNSTEIFPSILSLGGKAKTTRTTAANIINVIARITRGYTPEEIYRRPYTFYTEAEKGDKGEYAVVKYKVSNEKNSDERCAFYKSIRADLKRSSEQIIDATNKDVQDTGDEPIDLD
jgi:hypothetical protein